jgi:hypothetical protein
MLDEKFLSTWSSKPVSKIVKENAELFKGE